MSETTPAIERYRRIAALRFEIQSAALAKVPRPIMQHWAKHLGLWSGKEIVAPDEFSASLLADLAVHTPWNKQDPGIWRHQEPQSEDAAERAALLDALRGSRFSLFRIAEPAMQGGVMVQEVGSEVPQWLMDEALARSVPPGAPFAARVAQLDEFMITTGAIVRVDKDIMDAVKGMKTRSAPDGRQDEASFASNLYKAVLEDRRKKLGIGG